MTFAEKQKDIADRMMALYHEEEAAKKAFQSKWDALRLEQKQLTVECSHLTSDGKTAMQNGGLADVCCLCGYMR